MVNCVVFLTFLTLCGIKNTSTLKATFPKEDLLSVKKTIRR